MAGLMEETKAKSGEGVGALLRASRVRCGEELSQVADALRIRLCHLEAIEAGRFNELPGPAYALGFVRTYANYLGLDGEEVVRRLRVETEIAVTKPPLSFPVPLSDSSMPSGAVVMVGLVVAAVAYGAYLAGTSRDGDSIARVSPVPERLARDDGRTAPPPAATATALPAINESKSPVSLPAPAAAALPAVVVSSPIVTSVAPPAASSFGAQADTQSAPSAPPSSVTAAAPAPTLTPAPPSVAASVPVPSSASSLPPAAAPTATQTAIAALAPAATPPEKPKRPRIEVLAKADSWIQVRD
ncbi:MAG: helix-turn-helix domain-containing protein, partial [Alphaproteobacteria bacterium]|nr:helix-turn-helix domain-containing protein [Alphaproteobacteria bacterium]